MADRSYQKNRITEELLVNQKAVKVTEIAE